MKVRLVKENVDERQVLHKDKITSKEKEGREGRDII